jgi:phosphoglycolate phosphatase-like HAD superfamily hydrolase
MITKLILFDLEWVTYDPIKKTLCKEFYSVYNFAKTNNIIVAIATWATKKEIEYIAKKIPLRELFWTNIFCSLELGYESKKNPLFFSQIIKILWLSAENSWMIDDGNNGIQWAKLAWLYTYYVWNKKIDYCDYFGSITDFLSFLQTNNDN